MHKLKLTFDSLPFFLPTLWRNVLIRQTSSGYEHTKRRKQNRKHIKTSEFNYKLCYFYCFFYFAIAWHMESLFIKQISCLLVGVRYLHLKALIHTSVHRSEFAVTALLQVFAVNRKKFKWRWHFPIKQWFLTAVEFFACSEIQFCDSSKYGFGSPLLVSF